jgi:5-methylcytosine-specific restriction protein B
MTNLVEELRLALIAAPKGDRVVSIHLFGIRHAKRLRGANLRELAERAGIGPSFGTELRKGVRLAEFVEIKS